MSKFRLKTSFFMELQTVTAGKQLACIVTYK